MTNVTIQGREYLAQPTGRDSYILTGPRGATWLTVRYSNRPELMRLMNFKGRDLYIAGNQVVVTDASGDLREAR